MRIDIVSIFPGMFRGVLGDSIIKRAQEKKLVDINLVDLRDFTTDKHKSVDDYSYGGGPGMVMKPEPFFRSIEKIKKESTPLQSLVLLMSPHGAPFNQRMAEELARENHLVFLCGHYEGIDERVIDSLVDREISLGDYVLTGGELPAMVITDAVVRLLPGVIAEDSIKDESFNRGLLEYPQYTRPSEYCGKSVPEILLSGDHAKIELWRKREALKKTLTKRPDLLKEADLSSEEKKILQDIKLELNSSFERR